MLRQVLHEVESARGAIRVDEISQRLGIERGVVEDMIQFWVRKGRLQMDEDATMAAAPAACATGSCGGSCPGPQGCPFIMKMPRTYSLKSGSLKSDSVKSDSVKSDTVTVDALPADEPAG
jgi:hypothetical protein